MNQTKNPFNIIHMKFFMHKLINSDLYSKYRVLVLFFLCAIFFSLHGQEIQKIAPHVPTSPQAEAFQKYGDYSINYSTGVPDISIPLYEINHRGYKLPMVLKYYPAPLKPGYNYDVYGQGWGLSINSCISRSIEYLPDEWRDFKIETNKFNDYYYECPSCASLCSGNIDCDLSLQSHVDLSYYNFAHDKFTAVLPNGTSFEFIIEYGPNYKPVFKVSDGRQVIISCNYGTYNINSFTVIDEDGVKYTFDGSDTPYQGPRTNFSSSYVSWQLTRIDLPFTKEPITFSYDYTIESEFGLACQEPGILIADYREWVNNGGSNNADLRQNVSAQDVPSSSPYYYKMKLLSSINYGNAIIRILYKDENAIANYNYVKEIRISENSSLVKDIKLDMTIKNITGYCLSSKLAKLDSVSIRGSNLLDKPMVYKCSYFEQGNFGFTGTDHWGYLNDGDITYDVANFNLFVEFNINDYPSFLNARISPVEKSSQDLCPYSKIKISRYPADNRRPSPPERHGVLSTLTYPTGGQTKFEFENHKFLTSTDQNGNFIFDRQNRVVSDAAGFRIKKITNYTKEGTVADVKTYRYGKTYGEQYNPNYPGANFHTGWGEAVADPNILTYMSYNYDFVEYPPYVRNMILGLAPDGSHTSFINPFSSMCQICTFRWECTFSATNFRNIVNGRPPVLYPEVTVYNGDIYFNSMYSPERTSGKTVYKYDITEHGFDLLGNEYENVFFEEPHYLNNVIDYTSQRFRYNKLKEVDYYKLDETDYTLVKKENFNWSIRTNDFLEYKYFNHYPAKTTPPYINLGAFFTYKICLLGTSLMQSKSTTFYSFDKESFVSTENYTYNNWYQIDSIKFINSKDQIVEKIFSYPGSFTNGDMPEIYQKMLAKNIISPVIKNTINVYDRSQTPVEKFGSKIDYKEYTIGDFTIMMPAQTYELEIKPSGNEYMPQNEILNYSVNGNPLEFVSKDGIRSGYLWGYNDRYMVVKADNLDNAALASLVTTSLPSGFPTLDELLNSITSLPNTNWTNFNRNLRNNAPAKVMITTYTYKPLFGMTSQTDPNGISSFYDYDSLGRLKLVKDDKGNILNEYKIHFKE